MEFLVDYVRAAGFGVDSANLAEPWKTSVSYSREATAGRARLSRTVETSISCSWKDSANLAELWETGQRLQLCGS